jgi:hypothetical protein
MSDAGHFDISDTASEANRATTARTVEPTTLGDLRRGATYRAVTATGSTTGEYLGVETSYGGGRFSSDTTPEPNRSRSA